MKPCASISPKGVSLSAKIYDFSGVVDAVEGAEGDDDEPPFGGGGGGGGPGDGSGGGSGDDETFDLAPHLPAGGPVVPLGKGEDGETHFYLTADRIVLGLAASKHQANALISMFGTQAGWAFKKFPRAIKKKGEARFDSQNLAIALMTACAHATAKNGVFNPIKRMRGRGAWLGAAGELIVHCGDMVFVAGVPQRPGVIGRHIYSAAEPVGWPVDDKETPEPGYGEDLFETLKTWNWLRKHRDLDARLYLGAIGAGMIGGALKVRPIAWVTGDEGTGKSALIKITEHMFDRAVICTTDATPRGIAQLLGRDSVPVLLDESETREDNSKLQAMVELARSAYSGGLSVRGSSDHEAKLFILNSSFILGSILLPPLENQDISRMAILELRELSTDNEPLDTETAAPWANLGHKLRRRLMDRFRQVGETIVVYRQALMSVGHSHRNADQFGTLLAIAHVMKCDVLPSVEDLAADAELLHPARLSETRKVPNWRQCCDHVLSATIDAFRSGERRLVAEAIKDANANTFRGMGSRDSMQRDLERSGIKIFIHPTENHPNGKEKRFLAVAWSHRGTATIFEKSKWAGRAGLKGPWVQALSRAPGAVECWGTLRFAGVASRAVLVPLETVVDHSDDDEDPKPEPSSSRNPFPDPDPDPDPRSDE